MSNGESFRSVLKQPGQQTLEQNRCPVVATFIASLGSRNHHALQTPQSQRLKALRTSLQSELGFEVESTVTIWEFPIIRVP